MENGLEVREDDEDENEEDEDEEIGDRMVSDGCRSRKCARTEQNVDPTLQMANSSRSSTL